MQIIPSKYAPHTYAILRIMAGLAFMMHGTQKLLGFPGAVATQPVGSLAWVAGALELVLGAMIAAGLFTSLAAFIACGLMAVAYFMAHAPRGFWPVVNKGELAVIYCFLFLYMAAQGSGIWSLDNMRKRTDGSHRS